MVWGLAVGTDGLSGWVGEFAEGVTVGLGVGDGEICDRWGCGYVSHNGIS
jgi:hypothetical protein